MNQPHFSAVSAVPRRKKRRSQSKSSGKNPVDQWIAAEIVLKLVFNSVLSIAAIAALTKLLPYQLIQRQKLQEVRVEVQDTEQRVDELRDNFNRNFDPQQSRKIMQEQSPMIDPSQRRIIIVEDKVNPAVASQISSAD